MRNPKKTDREGERFSLRQRGVFCHFGFIVLGVLLFPGGPAGQLAFAEEDFPRKPIKVIVPFGSGGASDTLARVIQEGARRSEASSQPLVIVNVPGVGGTLGSRRVKNARPDGYTILNLHEAILTARYSETVDYGPDSFVPIASTGQAHTVVCAGPDSEWKSLEQILQEAKEKPGSILYGGNLGAPSHFVGLLLENLVEGAEFRIVPLGGGAERYTKLAGGHIDLSIFSVSEFKEFQKSPERPEGLQGIVYLGPARHEELPEIPTAHESGYSLETGTTQYWWAPKGTPEPRIETIRSILAKSMASEFVKTRYAELGIEPELQDAEEVTRSLAEFDARLAALDLDTGNAVDPLPLVLILFGGVLVFGVVLIAIRVRCKEVRKEERADLSLWWIAVLLVVYLTLLQGRVLPYWISTTLFAGVLGWLLAEGFPRRVAAICLALSLGIGLSVLFKSVLIIDLP